VLMDHGWNRQNTLLSDTDVRSNGTLTSSITVIFDVRSHGISAVETSP